MTDPSQALAWLKALDEGATRGPWSWRGGFLRGPYIDAETEYYGLDAVIAVNYAAQCPHLTVGERSAALIAHVRNVLPQLIGVVDAALYVSKNNDCTHGIVGIEGQDAALAALAEAVAREQGAT